MLYWLTCLHAICIHFWWVSHGNLADRCILDWVVPSAHTGQISSLLNQIIFPFSKDLKAYGSSVRNHFSFGKILSLFQHWKKECRGWCKPKWISMVSPDKSKLWGSCVTQVTKRQNHKHSSKKKKKGLWKFSSNISSIIFVPFKKHNGMILVRQKSQ